MTYNLRLTYNVKLANWRIDNPLKDNNSEWLLMVFDRNLKEWVYVGECDRPGEGYVLEQIEVLGIEED